MAQFEAGGAVFGKVVANEAQARAAIMPVASAGAIFGVTLSTFVAVSYTHLVFPLANEISHVEFRGGMGNLAVAYKLPVKPDIKAGIHPFKVQVLPLVRRFQIELEARLIGAAGVVQRDVGRVVGEGVFNVGCLLYTSSQRHPRGEEKAYRAHQKAPCKHHCHRKRHRLPGKREICSRAHQRAGRAGKLHGGCLLYTSRCV